MKYSICMLIISFIMFVALLQYSVYIDKYYRGHVTSAVILGALGWATVILVLNKQIQQ